jgi:drug/metabolite transporter (DMT)-like permease
VLLAGGLLLASVLLHLRDPHRSGSWGYCPWLFLTGTYCPGCGGLRAVEDLTRGDVGAAASSNLLLVAVLPGFAWWWTRRVVDGWRGTVRTTGTRPVVVGVVGFAVVALAFTVLRNTPTGAWLAP